MSAFFKKDNKTTRSLYNYNKQMIWYIKHYYSNIFEGTLKLNFKTVGKRFTILFI